MKFPDRPQTSEEFQRTDEAHARVAEALERKAEALPLVQARGWWCTSCSVEVQSARCQHCGKTRRERV